MGIPVLLHLLHIKRWIIFLVPKFFGPPQQQKLTILRLKTETYVNLQNQLQEEGSRDLPTAVQALFKDGTSEQVFYQGFLHDVGHERLSHSPENS